MSALKSKSPADSSPNKMRLQRFLASAGLGSRRKCEEFITSGRVTVDGQVASRLGVSVDPETEKVCVDGELIRPQLKRYYLLNKPPGCLCTNRDPAGRMRVIDFFPDDGTRLFTVGRLDENSEGLLLVTNDGDMAQRLAHPRYRVSRVYHVQVVGKPTQAVFDQLRKGLHLAEGHYKFHRVRRLRQKGASTVLEIEVRQGQNRVIRRMMVRVGHKVIHLQRVAFGPLKLGRLGLGKFRTLRATEIRELRALMDRTQPKNPTGRKRGPRGPRKTKATARTKTRKS